MSPPTPRASAATMPRSPICPAATPARCCSIRLFPLVLKGGQGCRIEDVDGHGYTDYLGEYTAGLYGHSNPLLQAAMHKARR